MNGLRQDAIEYAGTFIARAAESALRCDIALFPPATLLAALAEITRGTTVGLGGQDCHVEPSGAHTGDVSAAMLADVGCRYVIVGHSERRFEHGETDSLIRAKAEAAHCAGLCAVICLGEDEVQRDAGRALEVVEAQLSGSLPADARAGNTVVAYEPVWAIGSGRTPNTTDIATVHAHLRGLLCRSMPDEGTGVRLLYGGSVKPDNAAEILAVADVDGALVGGASLNVDAFWTICQCCP